MRYAEGENFTIDIEDGVAVVRVFRRSDLDSGKLGALAEEIVPLAKALTTHDGVTGMVVDLRRVNGAVAPRVEQAYGAVAATWEATAQPIAFLVGEAVQRMQIGRVVSQFAARCGGLFSERDDARRFAGATRLGPPTAVNDLLRGEPPTKTRRNT